MPTSARAANGGPYDITIVGAGMAGLYSAWRLLSATAQKNSQIIQDLIRQNGTASYGFASWRRATAWAAGSTPTHSKIGALTSPSSWAACASSTP
jgi:cation diffusion facilitator CzcD-associated flavoprotein CzcO